VRLIQLHSSRRYNLIPFRFGVFSKFCKRKKLNPKMSVVSIKDVDQFEKTVKTDSLAVVLFSAPWAQQCQDIETVFKELHGEHKDVIFANVEAETIPEVCLSKNVNSVPTVLYFRKGEVLDRVDGVKVSEITSKVKTHAQESAAAPAVTTEKQGEVKAQEPIEERLKKLISRDNVMLFMKGSPDQPRCGFSRTIVEILRQTGVPFGHFDILQDEEVRQSLKTFVDWHTYPQLYVKGELVGGLDIVKELQQNGELQDTLSA